MFKCFICQAVHVPCQSLISHLRLDHSFYPSTRFKLVCAQDRCRGQFSTYSGFKKHLISSHEKDSSFSWEGFLSQWRCSKATIVCYYYWFFPETGNDVWVHRSLEDGLPSCCELLCTGFEQKGRYPIRSCSLFCADRPENRLDTMGMDHQPWLLLSQWNWPQDLLTQRRSPGFQILNKSHSAPLPSAGHVGCWDIFEQVSCWWFSS